MTSGSGQDQDRDRPDGATPEDAAARPAEQGIPMKVLLPVVILAGVGFGLLGLKPQDSSVANVPSEPAVSSADVAVRTVPVPAPADPVPERPPEEATVPDHTPIDPPKDTPAEVADPVPVLAPVRPAPVPEMTATERMRAWLATYDIGECGFFRVSYASDTAITLLAYGRDPGPFHGLLTDFEAAHQVEPDIVFQPVTDGQCAVLNFTKAQTTDAFGETIIHLSDDTLSSGERVFGTVSGLAGRNLWTALVDPEGNLIELGRYLERLSVDEAQFDTALSRRSDGGAAPYIILAVVSDGDLSFAEGLQTAVSAADALAVMDRRLRLDGTAAEAGIRYFQLE